MIDMVEPKEFIKKRKELVKKITEQFWIREKANKSIKGFKSEMDALVEGIYG
jgi:hypothetical protein